MNGDTIIIKYIIQRSTDKNRPRNTYFIRAIPEENAENLDWLHAILRSDPIIPCEIETIAEQALLRRLRKNPRYQKRDIIFERRKTDGYEISGIEDVGFEWHTTRKSTWIEKTQELDAFLLYIQYKMTDPTYVYRICKTLNIIPNPLTSETPVLVQFEGEPSCTDLVTRETMMKFFYISETTLKEWKKKHILVSRGGTKTRVFYYVSHINKAFEKRFHSKNLTDKRWYRKTYKKLKHFYGE